MNSHESSWIRSQRALFNLKAFAEETLVSSTSAINIGWVETKPKGVKGLSSGSSSISSPPHVPISSDGKDHNYNDDHMDQERRARRVGLTGSFMALDRAVRPLTSVYLISQYMGPYSFL